MLLLSGSAAVSVGRERGIGKVACLQVLQPFVCAAWETVDRHIYCNLLMWACAGADYT